MIHKSYIVQGIEIDLSVDSSMAALLSDYFTSLYTGDSPLHMRPVQCRLSIVKKYPVVPANAAKAVQSPAVTVYNNGKEIYFVSTHGSTISLDPVEMKAIGFFKEEFHNNSSDFSSLLGASLVEILRYYGLFFLHAAAIQVDNTAYLISGDGGTGKTTAVMNLIREGFQYVADDSLFLKDDNGDIVVSPMYKHVHVDRDLAARFPEISGGKGLKIKAGAKVPVDISYFYPEAFIPSLKPDIIILPAITSAETSVATSLTQTEMYKRLLKQTVLAADKHVAQEQLRILGALVRQTKGFALFSGRDIYEDPSILVGHMRKMNA